MNDLISRQAAIDALKNEQSHYAHEDGVEIFYEYNRAIKALEKLPSAQPASYRQVTGKLDCISRQEAMEDMDDDRK